MTGGRECASTGCAIILSLALAACGDGSGPGTPDQLHLAVTVSVDLTSFPQSGEFDLDLVPSDASGKTYIADNWTIAATLGAPTTISATILGNSVEPADTSPVSAAVLIDDSGSMRSSDPDRVRSAAAQLFWNTVLPAREGNQVAILDFGRGDSSATPGFDRTRLLADFTSDAAVLTAAVANIQAVPGGATPLYQSGLEVIQWMDTVTAPTSQRLLVVITDGAPSDPTVAQQLYPAARAAGIRVFAVGLGAAAQDDPPTDATLRLLELASRTGGVYGAADSAEQLRPLLMTLAQSASPARLLVHLQVTPVPDPGTVLSGDASVSGIRGTASATWTFVAP
ncbi:MAG: vWA domain-containing protein [Gemmatimonadales bacterium]